MKSWHITTKLCFAVAHLSAAIYGCVVLIRTHYMGPLQLVETTLLVALTLFNLFYGLKHIVQIVSGLMDLKTYIYDE